MQMPFHEMDLDGYAVGGLAVGETHEEMYHILDEVVPHLPQDKPTYLMGVGTPANILEGSGTEALISLTVYIRARNGRHGHVYTNHGKLNMFNSKYELDPRPIEEGLSVSGLPSLQQSLYPPSSERQKRCLACGFAYCTIFIFITIIMEEIRDALDAGNFAEYKKMRLEGFEEGMDQQ